MHWDRPERRGQHTDQPGPGVSAQTVYNVFGTKAGLLKAAYDVALVGDSELVPLAERPEVRALYADPDPARFLRGYARLGRTLFDRIGPLMLQVAAGAAAGEPDLVAHQETTDRERLTGTGTGAGTGFVARRLVELDALAPGLTVEAARDRIWTLNSVEVWHLLTARRGVVRRPVRRLGRRRMAAAALRLGLRSEGTAVVP